MQPPAKKAKIAYKFHEGFSNAVRMNVKVGNCCSSALDKGGMAEFKLAGLRTFPLKAEQ